MVDIEANMLPSSRPLHSHLLIKKKPILLPLEKTHMQNIAAHNCFRCQETSGRHGKCLCMGGRGPTKSLLSSLFFDQALQGQIIQQPGGGTFLIQSGTVDGDGAPLTHTTRASPITVGLQMTITIDLFICLSYCFK